MSAITAPILVTGAAGRVGGIGRHVAEALLASNTPVRALVRKNDERAERLRKLGADVVEADLTRPEQVFRALQGCRRVFFTMSVSSEYLEATTVMAAAARGTTDIEIVVNLSQFSASEITITEPWESRQHREQWLSEQVLNWSGLPVTHIRPTVFQENILFWNMAAVTIGRTGKFRGPFGQGRSSPIAASDVAEVVVRVLLDPAAHVGRAIELTGPESVDMSQLCQEYSTALGFPVDYEGVSLETFSREFLDGMRLPPHVYQHIRVMAEMHAQGGYDRFTNSVEEILGHPATRLSTTIMNNRELFPLVSEPS